MTIHDRIQKIINDLFAKNKRAFSIAIGVTPSVTENIVGKRKSSPSYEVINKILSSIENLSVEWLITGKGDMYSIPVASESVVGYGKNFVETLKPFFDSGNIYLRTPDAFSNAISNNDYQSISIPFTKDYDFSLRVYGDSMINTTNNKHSIYDQDIVMCKLWNDRSHIRWGEVYALVTIDGCFVKKIMESELADHIKCVSFNEKDYPAYNLPLSEVLDKALVVGKFSTSVW